MKIVDTRGDICPKPIIATKKALKETSAGESFIVLTDNKTSYNNISRFLSDNGIKFSVAESTGVWTFKVNNDKGNNDTKIAEDYCETESKIAEAGDYAVEINSEFMGSGDDNLGKKLMKSFFISLSCLEKLPSVVVFYNSGVKLAVKDSEIAEYLVELEKKGVELILCGTCVDYFRLDGKLCAGKIGDMYLILKKLSHSGKVIRP